MCGFSDLIMFSLRIVISAPDVCLGVYGGAWWLLTGLLIGHLVYVLLSSVTPIPSCCAVVHHFRMSCDKAALTHFCQLNVARVKWTWLRLELIKHFNFTPNNKAAQEHHCIKTRV